MQILVDDEVNNIIDGAGKICATYWPLQTDEEGYVGMRIETENNYFEVTSRTHEDGGNNLCGIFDEYIEYYSKTENEFDEDRFLEKLDQLKKLVDPNN